MMSRLSPVKIVRFVQLGVVIALLGMVWIDEYYIHLICLRWLCYSAKCCEGIKFERQW